MTAPQREEPKRKVLVAPNLRDRNTRNLILAGVAAMVSLGAHGLLLFLVLNLDLGSAQSQTNPGDITSASIIDDPKEERKDDKKEDDKPADRGKEDVIDLSRPDIGDNSWHDAGPKVPDIGEKSVPEPIPDARPDDVLGPSLPLPPGVRPPDGDPSAKVGIFPDPTRDNGTAPRGGVPNPLEGRTSPDTRRKMLEADGGNAVSEAMVAKGLQFLSNHQAPDGHWSMHEFDRHARKKNPKGDGYIYEKDRSDPRTSRQNDIAGTAFGLLPFLAAGHTQNPVKDSRFDYSKQVKGGLDFLKRQQDRNKDGYFGGDMYAHGIATIAMCEAYGLTADNGYKVCAQKAINYIEYAQDPAGGGWRYGPRQPGDTSVVGWQLMALKSGQMAGLTVKAETLKKVEKYLDSCESTNKGGYGYTPGGGETVQMTAVGLLCRQYLGVTPRNPGLLAGVQRLEQAPPSRGQSIYYMYYATQVMHHMGGENWDRWNKGPKGDGQGGIRDELIAAMDKGTTNPDTEGSWVLAGAEGRLMSTSLALLTLEVYYRHLPLYRRDVGQVKGAQ